MSEPKFQRGDMVYVKFTSVWSAWTFMCSHEEMGGTATLRRGDESATCRISELRTVEENEERVNNYPTKRLADVVRAFQAGHTTPKKVAVFLGLRTSNVTSRFYEAVRRGFIEVKVDVSGSESAPPYVEGTSEDPRASVTPDGTVRMD